MSERKLVLDTAYKYLGIVEIPKGSNRSPQIDIWTHNHAEPWCADFICGIFHEATGHFPVGDLRKGRIFWRRIPGTATMWRIAKENGFAKIKGQAEPELGDIVYIRHKDGTGHVVFVTGLKKAGDRIIGIYFIGGNTNDGVREGFYLMSMPTLVGFIDPYSADDKLDSYDKINLKAKDMSDATTR